MPFITRHSTLALGILAVGCTRVTLRENADHCTHNEGDRYCAELFPERPYCNQGKDECSIGDRYGCVAEVAPECHAPCGVLEEDECVAGSSTGTDSGTSGGTEASSGSSGSSSGESSSTTGPVPCTGDEDCTDATAPFCDVGSGECVPCDQTEDPDGSCAVLDPALPICADGACVQCTPENPVACTDETPVCDGVTQACVPCVAHDQCGGVACNLFTGACLPAGAVVHVGPGQAFTELVPAIASFPGGAEGTIVVHEDAYNEAATVDGTRTLAFLAADGDLPLWSMVGGGTPQLTVSAGSTVLMDGMQLSGNGNNRGLRVNGGRAWVDRSRVVQNSGGGVLAENGAELVMRSCFVGSGGAVDTDAIVVNGASLDLLYTTVGGGAVISQRTRALYCQGAAVVTARNSVLVSLDMMPEVECAGATLTNTATEAESGMLSAMWFANYATGDFTLTASGATTFADVAVWSVGDPGTDIEGDPRPEVDGSPDYAGADVP